MHDRVQTYCLFIVTNASFYGCFVFEAVVRVIEHGYTLSVWCLSYSAVDETKWKIVT